MNVVVCPRPGTLLIEQRPVPTPAPGEVLIRVRRVGMCGTDMHIFRGVQPYLTYPRVMGHEVSGEVAAAPAGSKLRPGDPVYVVPYLSCGKCNACRKHKPNCCQALEVLGVHRDGALVQYLCLPERFVFSAHGITLDEAAMVEFLAIGAHAVSRGDVTADQHVLVCGSGPIGIACALFSKLRGASVTVVDIRSERLSLCRDQLGIERAFRVDADMDARLLATTDGNMFDVVFDATGNPEAMQRGFSYIAHGGTYVLVSVVNADITFSDPEFHKREARLLASRNATAGDFEFVIECIRAGKIPVAHLRTHSAPLAELPAKLADWIKPESRVIKAVVEC
ncbi:MAG: zinc-binding alcohol dehydrogenase family protein [Xanthomonadaceae bacterium]|nr:zinc-binding alcohol dehydrogenase family protein [Xanthomonadaceae bacterium]